jgi:hypothetical protein
MTEEAQEPEAPEVPPEQPEADPLDFRGEVNGTLRAHPDDVAQVIMEIADLNGFSVTKLCLRGAQFPFPSHTYATPPEG